MVKKQNALQNKLGVILQNKYQSAKAIKEKEKREKEFKKQKAETKKLAQALGRKKVNHIHLNKYTDSLKSLIGRLHDENTTNTNVPQAQAKEAPEEKNKTLQGLNDYKSDDGKKAKQYDDLLKATGGNSLERKEKLKVRLLNES